MSDLEIIELYWQRDQQAIAETQRSYGGKLQALSDRILRSVEDAQECVNDTYMKTWETLPPQKPSFLYAYLAKLCRNFSLGRLDWRNAAKRKAEVISIEDEMNLCIPGQGPEEAWEGKELAKAINAFLGTLSQESRMIFMRRYFHCDTTAEIAQRYGITEGKVKTRLHRARNQLRDYLAEEGIAV